MDKIEFNRVRDFSALLNATFEFIRQNFRILLKSTIFIVGPFILLAGVFGGLYQSSVFSFKAQTNTAGIFIPFLLYFFFLMLAVFILMIVVYSIIDEYLNSDTLKLEMDLVWRRFKQNFWMILLTGLGYVITVVIGSLFLIIPGIYLAVTLSLIYMVRIVEKKNFFDSIGRCINTVKKNWWFTFGLTLVLGLIQGFLGFIFYIPSYIAMFFTAMSGINFESNGEGSPSEILFIITTIVSSISLIFYSISLIGVAFQYFNLVERKEAPGLMAKIDSIGE